MRPQSGSHQAGSRPAQKRFPDSGTLPESCEIKDDYREAINDPNIDVVAVSLPHHLHEKVCVEAAEAGKQIMVDKPIARTLEEADRIIEAVDRNKVTMMTAFNMRFMPMYKKIHDVVVSGGIGEPIYAITRHYQGFNQPAGARMWVVVESESAVR